MPGVSLGGWERSAEEGKDGPEKGCEARRWKVGVGFAILLLFSSAIDLLPLASDKYIYLKYQLNFTAQ